MATLAQALKRIENERRVAIGETPLPLPEEPEVEKAEPTTREGILKRLHEIKARQIELAGPPPDATSPYWEREKAKGVSLPEAVRRGLASSGIKTFLGAQELVGAGDQGRRDAIREMMGQDVKEGGLAASLAEGAGDIAQLAVGGPLTGGLKLTRAALALPGALKGGARLATEVLPATGREVLPRLTAGLATRSPRLARAANTILPGMGRAAEIDFIRETGEGGEPATLGERLGGAAGGAALMGVGGAVGGLLSSGIRGFAGRSAEKLLREGIELTPGGVAPLPFRSIEAMGRNIPFVGRTVRAGQKGLEQSIRKRVAEEAMPRGTGPLASTTPHGMASEIKAAAEQTETAAWRASKQGGTFRYAPMRDAIRVHAATASKPLQGVLNKLDENVTKAGRRNDAEEIDRLFKQALESPEVRKSPRASRLIRRQWRAFRANLPPKTRTGVTAVEVKEPAREVFETAVNKAGTTGEFTIDDLSEATMQRAAEAVKTGNAPFQSLINELRPHMPLELSPQLDWLKRLAIQAGPEWPKLYRWLYHNPLMGQNILQKYAKRMGVELRKRDIPSVLGLIGAESATE